MTEAEGLSLGLLVLRLSVAYLFLFAGVSSTKSAAAWSHVKGETALFFIAFPTRWQHALAHYAAIIGMILLYGGGLSVLLGFEARLGGLMVTVFSLLGLHIHAVHRREALAAAEAGDPMGLSAYAGRFASGMKNWVIIAAGITFFLAGAGRYAVGTDYLGKALGIGN